MPLSTTSNITTNSNYPNFKNHVLTMLGSGLVSVELEDDQIVQAFHRAKEMFKRYASGTDRRQFVALDVKPDVTEYTLPVNNIETIVNVIQNQGNFRTEDPFHHRVVNDFMFGNNNNTQDLLVYNLTIQEIENLKTYSAFHRQWIHKYHENKIEFLKKPYADERWFLEAYTNFSDNELMEIDVIQRFTTSEAKAILGRAYSKFSSVGGPAGDMKLPGSELIQEANNEKEQIIEEMKKFVAYSQPIGMPILMG